MSRVGKKPVVIPSGVTAVLEGQTLKVKGPKGELSILMHPNVSATISDNTVLVSVTEPGNTHHSALWGTHRNLIENMMQGVTNGFSKQLEVNGVGYRVSLSGKKLVFEIGYSHPVEFSLPVGIEASVDKNTIILKGADKQLVGEIAAQLRSLRPPEPYKGKGIKYSDETVRRKAGKAAKTGAA